MDERVIHILKHPATLPTAVGLVSFGLGMGVGYLVRKRQEQKMFEENDLDDQSYLVVEEDLGIEGGFNELREQLGLDEDARPRSVFDADEYLARVRQEEEVDDEDDEDYEEYDVEPDILEDDDEGITLVSEDDPDDIVLVKDNVFANSGSDWDYDEELKKRSPSSPYVIHYDEFWENEPKYSQLTLTYYAQDDILADEDNAPIYNHHSVVGEMKFGHGSGDSDTVYIRNDSNRAQYEILRVDKMYSREVMGLEIENNARARDLRHSSVPGKFRPDD